MLPPGVVGLADRLDMALKKHRAQALRAPILKAAEAQIALFPTEDLTTLPMGEIHERARKLDPSIPRGFNAAMKSPGEDGMMALLRARTARSDFKPGASRVGGMPDLPEGVAWPKRGGKYLPFVAQIKLAGLPRWEGNPLPSSGWLWAFAGGSSPLACAVIHWVGDAKALRRQSTPRAEEMLILDYLGKPEYKPIPLQQAEVIINVPGYGSEWWNVNVDDEDERLGDAMMELVESLQQPPNHPDKGGYAVLLGRLGFEESPSELAVRYGKKKGKDWVPLLQVGSVGNMCWSDEGTLAFLVRAADLAKRDFSDAYATILSS
jgi:uncharacterized protein YwqG